MVVFHRGNHHVVGGRCHIVVVSWNHHIIVVRWNHHIVVLCGHVYRILGRWLAALCGIGGRRRIGQVESVVIVGRCVGCFFGQVESLVHGIATTNVVVDAHSVVVSTSFRIALWKGVFHVYLFLVSYLGGFGEQVFGAHLQWGEMLGVELLIVIIAELLAQEFHVVAADEDDACFPCQPHDVGLTLHLAGILVRLVEIAETREFHQMDAVGIFDFDIEVAHHERGEVEARHLEEQLILIERVGRVGDDKEEIFVAVGHESAGSDGVAVVEHGGTAAPHIAQVEFATMQLTACFHSIHYHAGHLADTATGIVFHHIVHVLETAVGVAVVQAAQSTDEDELVAVGTQRESGLRNMSVAEHFLVTVGLEGFVGSGIERVFDMLAPFGVLHIIGVGEDGGPLTVGITLP